LKTVISILALAITTTANAIDVKCYSSGVKFYEKNSNDVYVGEGFVKIRNNNKVDVVTADCIVRYIESKAQSQD